MYARTDKMYSFLLYRFALQIYLFKLMSKKMIELPLKIKLCTLLFQQTIIQTIIHSTDIISNLINETNWDK